jgi:hypothetical protein
MGIINFLKCNAGQCRVFGWIRIHILDTDISVAKPDHFGVTGAGAAMAYSSDGSGSEPDGQHMSTFKHVLYQQSQFLTFLFHIYRKRRDGRNPYVNFCSFKSTLESELPLSFYPELEPHKNAVAPQY